jgi:hypothetical protein
MRSSQSLPIGAIYGGFPQGCYRAVRCYRRPCGRKAVSLSDEHRFANSIFLAGMPGRSAPTGEQVAPRDAAEPFGPTNGGFPAASRTDPSARRRRPRRSMLQTTRRHRNQASSDRPSAQKMENSELFIRAHDPLAVRVPWRRSTPGLSSTSQTAFTDQAEMQTIMASHSTTGPSPHVHEAEDRT